MCDHCKKKKPVMLTMEGGWQLCARCWLHGVHTREVPTMPERKGRN